LWKTGGNRKGGGVIFAGSKRDSRKGAKNLLQTAMDHYLCAKYFRPVMFAIVTIAGQQFKVRKDDVLFVNRLEGSVGDSLEFSDVLMSTNSNNEMSLGAGPKIQAEIIEHLKGDKVIVFKKKRRKGYQKMNGHRQSLTRIRIGAIG
jgi:large subunit ribosomal protein L21